MRKKMDNKGFSLVELIIVIAIMAVLVAVLAPQYMKFVERGRAASDRDNVDAIVSALQVYAVDTLASGKFEGTEKIVIEADKVTVTDTTTKPVENALKDAGLPYKPLASGGTVDKDTIPTLTNKETFDKVTIEVSVDDGAVKVTVAEE